MFKEIFMMGNVVLCLLTFYSIWEIPICFWHICTLSAFIGDACWSLSNSASSLCNSYFYWMHRAMLTANQIHQHVCGRFQTKHISKLETISWKEIHELSKSTKKCYLYMIDMRTYTTICCLPWRDFAINAGKTQCKIKFTFQTHCVTKNMTDYRIH